MIIYNNFNREYFQHQAVTLAPPPLKSVRVATDRELGRIWYFRRLAIATRALNLPRREVPNWMADIIFGYEGNILRLDGTQFIISDTAIQRLTMRSIMMTAFDGSRGLYNLRICSRLSKSRNAGFIIACALSNWRSRLPILIG